jgi:hypothetical protein
MAVFPSLESVRWFRHLIPPHAGYLIATSTEPCCTGIFGERVFVTLLRKQIEQKAKSTSGVNNINSGELQSLVIELESKLSEADQLDQTLATALQQSAALRQSILKKAFCGQLVKQDKNDEPASVLLERIRAEKLNGMKPGKREKSS